MGTGSSNRQVINNPISVQKIKVKKVTLIPTAQIIMIQDRNI